MKKLLHAAFDRWFPLTLAVLFALTWVYQVRLVGFFLDDWLYLSAYHQGGLDALQAYAFDDSRPGLLPYVIGLGFKLFGYNHLAWQIASLFWRYLGGVGLWLLIRTAWPRRREASIFAGILFALFPFFKHQAFPIAYYQIWVQGALVTFSFWLTVLALRAGSRKRAALLTAGAMLLSLIQLFMTEYYLPIELGRWVLIWLIVQRENSSSRRAAFFHSLRFWLPYALLLGFFLIARFAVMPRFVEDRNSLGWIRDYESPLALGYHVFAMALQYVTESIWGVWYRSIRPDRFDFTIISQRIGLAAAFFSFVVTLIGSRLIREHETSSDEARFSELTEMVWFGVALTILGFLPGMAIDKDPSSQFRYHDRFLIPAFLGLSLLTPSIILHSVRGPWFKTITLSTLVAISVNFQIVNSFDYRIAWATQQEFQWQLYRRVPDVQPNTAFLGDAIIASFMGGWADGAMVLEMYGKGDGLDETPYWYFVIGEGDYAAEFREELPLTHLVKIYNFRSEFGDNIVLTKPEWDRCLWVLEELDQYNPYISDITKGLIQYSDPTRIIYDSGWQLNSGIFGTNGPRDWCYAYESGAASVAQGKYNEALAYYEEAEANGWQVRRPVELTPFIRAAALTGDWAKAAELTERASWEPHITYEYFAHLWDELFALTADSPARAAALQSVLPFITAD